MSGLTADARTLVDHARVEAQAAVLQHRTFPGDCLAQQRIQRRDDDYKHYSTTNTTL